MGQFEDWTKKIYNPKIASWKRRVLLVLSILIGVGCSVASYTQINYAWSNNGIWWLICFFSFLSLLGIFVSLFCKDYWVALVLGGI